MFTAGMALRAALKASSEVFGESRILMSRLMGTCSTPSCTSALLSRHDSTASGSFAIQPVRHYARPARKKTQVLESQLSDLPPTMLKKEYAAVPLAQTTDDVVQRLLNLEFASHSEKLKLKMDQLIAKVQMDESDFSSPPVKVAILTTRIRNYQEHLQKHRKDKANKRRMLMAIDCRKKILKNLRLVNYNAFENVCQQLGITYTFPPEYYRRVTRRWLAKKALCIKVFQAVQKQKAGKKAEQRLEMKQSVGSTHRVASEKTQQNPL